MTYRSQYSDTVLNEMQLLYGEGYLSPGGAEEVDGILDGVTVRGCRVLDLGCGVGGAAMRMVRELGAETVLGLDVEERSLECADAKVTAAGLSRQIAFELVEPGPIPLADESFDIVFVKDVFCHLADKEPLFSEVSRVLRKGGVLALSAWTTGIAPMSETPQTQRVVRRPDGLVLYFEPLENYLQGLEQSGFTSILKREHSGWLLERTRRELESVQGMQGENETSQAMGQRIKVTQRRLQSLETDSLQHWHLQASRAT